MVSKRSSRLAQSLLSAAVVLGAVCAAAQQPAAAAGDAVALTGDAACTRCHDYNDPYDVLAISQSRHGVKGDRRTPGCQGCHGESIEHIRQESGAGNRRAAPTISYGPSNRSPAERQDEACLACHRGGSVLHWSGSPHQIRDVPCSNCHQIHAAQDRALAKRTQPEVCFNCHKNQRADVHKFSRHPLREGKMGCSDCHNPHGSTAVRMMQKPGITETCFTCHAEKRGPFLWEHPAVNEDCTNCHTPHGSNNRSLLKVRPPFLCQQCHSTTNHSNVAFSGLNVAPGLGGSAASVFMVGKSCLNCHSSIHGSNHPAGVKFQR